MSDLEADPILQFQKKYILNRNIRNVQIDHENFLKIFFFHQNFQILLVFIDIVWRYYSNYVNSLLLE